MHAWTKNAGRFASGTTLAGALVGFCEGRYQRVPPLYSLLLYATLWALAGLALGTIVAWWQGRRWPTITPANVTWGLLAAMPVSTAVLVRFVMFRDVFMEAPERQLAAAACGVGAACAVAALVAAIGFVTERSLLAVRPSTFRALAVPILACLSFAGVVASSHDDIFAQSTTTPSNRQGLGVILVVADALRADALGAYGAPLRDGVSLTPNLDAFAQESLVFTRASAQASWTKPAMASIMTSRHVSGHNTMAKAAVLPNTLPTLATALWQNGVHTSAVVTNYNLTSYFGFERGFANYRYLPPARYLGAPPEANRLAAYNVYRLVRERYLKAGREARFFYRDANTVNAQALDIIDRETYARYFLWLHYMEAHDPYFDAQGNTWAKVSDPHPKASDAAALRTAYEDGVRRFDAAFGTLIGGLQARHLLERTLVIVMSDHGEEFGEHGGFYHGTTLYEEMLHIPLIMHGPGLLPGVDGRLVRQIDIAPTIASFLRIPAPGSWEGTDALVRNNGVTTSLSEEDHEGNVLTALQVAAGDGGLKLILANADNPRGLRPTELYDLGQDPHEKTALPDGDARTLALSAQMRDIRLHAQKEGATSTETRLDAPAKAELRSLGYVQ